MTKNHLAAFLFAFLSVISLQGQSPYQVNWKNDGLALGIGTTMWLTSYGISHSVEPLTSEQIAGLDRSSVNGFDRWAIDRFSVASQDASDIFFYSSYALPALLLIPKETRHDFGTVALLYAETMVITSGITFLTKTTVKRNRPLMYNPTIGLEYKQGRSNRFSFFSGHSSETAANCFFVAKIFNDYFPDSPFRPMVWAGAAVIPAITGFLRVTGGKHFPTDVITGYVLGAATGILVPHFHKKRSAGNDGTGLTILPIPGGAFLQYNF